MSLLRQWFQQHLEKWHQAHAPLGCPVCLIAQDVNTICINVDAAPFVPEVVRTRGLWSNGAFADSSQHDVAETVQILLDSLNDIEDSAAKALDPQVYTRRPAGPAVKFTTPMWKAMACSR